MQTQRLLTAMLLAVAVATFTISAGSLYELAKAKHMAFPWLVPVMVDLSILAVSLAAFSSSCRGNDSRGLLTLAWTFTLMSATLNVCHVWTLPVDFVACFLHSMPPVVTTIVFEVLLADMRQARKVAPECDTVPPVTADRAKDDTTPQSIRKRAKRAARETMAERAKALGVSIRTLYRMRGKGVSV